ncbi:hypothetical protein STRCR_1050 [Streptococcus criceti HS-6]|uniref:Uncharacterized protein n=1 Tax=Streptococcus criceti HS-6 TaxID=873449 RepID=G5JT82_STRCG|nr:hypothetical protein STRCR_1050 [Streptococcus criceti HS-6]
MTKEGELILFGSLLSLKKVFFLLFKNVYMHCCLIFGGIRAIIIRLKTYRNNRGKHD